MPFRLANVAGRAVLLHNEEYYDAESLSGLALSSDPMLALGNPAELNRLSAGLAEAEPSGRVADVTFGPPVPRPSQCFGIGLNYVGHAAEAGRGQPETPLVFSKFPSCLNGPSGDVIMRSDAVDYEAELVVVIARTTTAVTTDDAWSHVAGLMVGQDISDREIQFRGEMPQFGLGKSFETYGPIGPELVSVAAFENPDDLAISCSVNGEERQSDRTSGLIFSVPQIISYLSAIVTLSAGDLIFTGTPAGVGAPKKNFLKDGDVITTSIEGIGTLSNRCKRGSDHDI